ncbi:hypothetical protein HO133_008036 [Letharia lupina]|uniref:RED-like N-terminal domain-containing protein n=1 Tax=Letharia lupina TaxID=560253 RepID=A0A8H6FHH1_9LECA|nr:uncharacterized protein HO133_008036 [Letharia lupina]KAF6228306.1 hypothetical protein HO133_008036 [Letharia lupina]
MNNTQFRRLVLDTPTAPKTKEHSMGSSLKGGGATPALGSRMRSNIPMTPRSVIGLSGNDFARQLAERNAEMNPSSTKKFRSSAAPKGTKLHSGYQDRTQLRTSGEEDDKATRVKALEAMVKLGQMDLATFEALRDEIVGGDVKDVHLVKGLDYKLLERVRRGEDVIADIGNSTKADEDHDENRQTPPEADVDDEFEKLEEKAIQPIAREQSLKKGEMARHAPVAGQKRTRDDILKELKESRLAAAESAKQAQKPALGPRFLKVGEKKERSRIEKDERGREILITIGEDGRVKRKVKKAKVDENDGLLMPDKDAKPLGMQVTARAPPVVAGDEDEGDIFEGVGVDYNPLGGVEGDDDYSNDSDGEGEAASVAGPSKQPPKASESETSSAMPPPPMPQQQSPLRRKRNYFGDTEEDKDGTDDRGQDPLADATILAALKKASAIHPFSTSESGNEDKIARRKKMLESHDRDADDMDMEFGSSRFGDAEDGEDRRVKLSVWDGDGGEVEGGGEGKERRKRGGKKRKGDVNSAADVLKVMERRKGESK